MDWIIKETATCKRNPTSQQLEEIDLPEHVALMSQLRGDMIQKLEIMTDISATAWP